MTPGDIVLIFLPFTDMSDAKIRPALVVSSKAQLTQGPDAIFMAITTGTANQKPTDFFLDQAHREFPATGLKVSSVFRVERLHCLEKKFAMKRLGTVGPRIRQEISNRLRTVLAF